ncbi:MAG: omptin family outer membrane protease [Gammaproteobacteria bacterium]|nr:omptin family outer membrane protease [Gammaproteobacteria bacterium]MDH5694302.1 omptin family outer membrane protease [Gammaproteobacteria bacterium]
MSRTGHVTYQIGGFGSFRGEPGYAHFPLSELKFPQDNTLAVLSFSSVIRNKYQLNIELAESLTKDNDDPMEDSDWGISFINPNTSASTLDVYSHSRVESESSEFDVSISSLQKQFKYRNQFFQDWTYSYGGGYLYQKQSFRTFDLVQWYPSTGAPTDTMSGLVLTYNVAMSMPYIQFQTESHYSSELNFSLLIKASPFLTVKDHDEHLLRDQASDGKSEGYAWELRSIAHYHTC